MSPSSSVRPDPPTVAMLPALSVAVTDTVMAPGVRPEMSRKTLPSLASAFDTTLFTPSLSVTTAVASPSMPLTTISTELASPWLMSLSGAETARLPSTSAEVSAPRSMPVAARTSAAVAPSTKAS